MKKTLSLILVVALVVGMTTVAYAATPKYTYVVHPNAIAQTTLERADMLKDMGLFAGTDKGYELETSPTRTQAVVFLLRMLGEEKAALNSNYTCPFTDVPSWAYKYIAYAYNKGYTNGISATQFGANDLVTPVQFVTFMLRALGYSDKNGDFTYSLSLKMANALGIICAEKYEAMNNFTRGDCVDIIYKVLNAKMKGKTKTLAKTLVEKGAVSKETAVKYGFAKQEYETVRVETIKAENGDLNIYYKDIAAKIPGTKTVLSYRYSGIPSDDYIWVNCRPVGDVVDITNDYDFIYSQAPDFVTSVFLVYDDANNLIATGIAPYGTVRANHYIDFALMTLDVDKCSKDIDAQFETLFGEPVEYKDAVVAIEKATFNLSGVSIKTGKTIFSNRPTEIYEYRLVFDKEKYPELAQVVYIEDEELPSGKTVSEAVRERCLQAFNNQTTFNGTFGGAYLASRFGTYKTGWVEDTPDFNETKYLLLFDADKKLIGYTTVIPSQTKIIDVGTLDITGYYMQ